MSRPADHKSLVDAIIDGEVSAKEIAQRAAELGATLSARSNFVMRKLIAACASGKITATQARKMWLEAFTALSLVGFAQIAQDVADNAAKATDEVITAARKLKGEVTKVGAVRSADKLAREAEKKGVDVNGNGET